MAAASKQATEEIAAQDEASKPQVKEPKAYGRPLAEIMADLSKPIAPQHLETLKKGGATLIYIPWHRAIRYLDYYAPGWSYEVRNIFHLEGRVALVVRISIPCAEGVVYREATGQEEEDTSSYGDPTSNAESMALRRAAAKFGLGLSLYDKGNGAGESHAGETSAKPKTLGDLVTPKQLWMARNLAKEADLDAEEECLNLLGEKLEEISKRAASSLIDHLKKQAEPANNREES